MPGQRLVGAILTFVAVVIVVQGAAWIAYSQFLAGGTSAGFPLPVWSCTLLPPISGFAAERVCKFSLFGALVDVSVCAGLTFACLRFLGRAK